MKFPKIKKNWWLLFIFNIAYILIFAFYYIYIASYEFLFYISVVVFLSLLIVITINKTKFNNFILWLLSFAGFLHMAGGGIFIGGKNLYHLNIIHLFGSGDSFVLRFDQVAHFYGIFVITIVAYHLLNIYLIKKNNLLLRCVVVFFIGIGWGALVEIQEFATVVMFQNTGVGGYYNNSLDLVFNALGAVTASIILYLKNKRETKNNANKKRKRI
ncbi:MAG: DUF2238 domain-containing protein [Candidatus Pacearchaeota archaeon]